MDERKSKGDLLEALDGFSNATANLRQLFGTENKGGDAGNNYQLRHTKSKQTVTRKALFPFVGGEQSGSVSICDGGRGFEGVGEGGGIGRRKG